MALIKPQRSSLVSGNSPIIPYRGASIHPHPLGNTKSLQLDTTERKPSPNRSFVSQVAVSLAINDRFTKEAPNVIPGTQPQAVVRSADAELDQEKGWAGHVWYSGIKGTNEVAASSHHSSETFTTESCRWIQVSCWEG